VHDLVESPLEGSHDVLMHEESPSLGFDDIVLPNPFDHSDASPLYSLPSQSPGYYLDGPINNFVICDANNDLGYENNVFDVLSGNANNFVSLGYFKGCDPSIDPYCVCLRDLPKKITWTTFFNPSYDFSKVIDKVKRMLNVFGTILVITSYLLFSKLWS